MTNILNKHEASYIVDLPSIVVRIAEFTICILQNHYYTKGSQQNVYELEKRWRNLILLLKIGYSILKSKCGIRKQRWLLSAFYHSLWRTIKLQHHPLYVRDREGERERETYSKKELNNSSSASFSDIFGPSFWFGLSSLSLVICFLLLLKSIKTKWSNNHKDQ